ncbi:hypothetical protein [Streptomyces longwoodensis]|uniref:hypothetical protein n=1 Tax=Streptomyces longwoodensis TaxID=68231 RepID=UPI0030E36D4B
MRRRTALSVVSAAADGALVRFSFASAPAAVHGRAPPAARPATRRDFDERTGASTLETADQVTGGWGHISIDGVNLPVRRQ